MFITSFLIGAAVGFVIGSIISLVINVYDEFLTSQVAKQKAAEELGKSIRTIIIKNVSKNGNCETISAKAIGLEDSEVADVTFHAYKGSSLYEGLRA
ncbi:MAG: hypothetical protein SOT07_09315 [Paludibacteraceae bacterium]|nr:hypothetical protein [Paludibacteraceae bacterium]